MVSAAVDQRMTVDHAARVERRKLRLRPAQHLHRRTVDQDLGRRRGPEHTVDQIVGPIGGVGDAVAVEIERRIVAPVISAASLRPVEVAGPDIFHLVAIADEGVAGDFIAFGAGREVHADAAAFKPVVAELVVVGVVDEHAFFRSAAGVLGRPGFRHHAALVARQLFAAARGIVERTAGHAVAIDLGVIGVIEQ